MVELHHKSSNEDVNTLRRLLLEKYEPIRATGRKANQGKKINSTKSEAIKHLTKQNRHNKTKKNITTLSRNTAR